MNVAVPLPMVGDAIVRIRDAECVADVSGVLYWPEQSLLVVSDLHLEKGSSFARRGALVPPYDTADTLTRLAAAVARYAPRVVVSLGDSFHDGDGVGRLAAEDRAALAALQRGRDWIWIAGNHDPEPLFDLGGLSADSFAVGGVTFRHIAAKKSAVGVRPGKVQNGFPSGRTTDGVRPGKVETGFPSGRSTDGVRPGKARPPLRSGAETGFPSARTINEAEISGHLHPVAVVAGRGRALRRRCVVTDGHRLIMPAFGAYAGGLSVRDRAFASILARDFTAHVLGDERVYAIPSDWCL